MGGELKIGFVLSQFFLYATNGAGIVQEDIRGSSTIGSDCEGRIAAFTKGKLVKDK